MKTLAIITTLFFLTLCHSSIGQRKSLLKEYHINCLNDEFYYSKAQQLTNFDNRDSLFEAYRILTRLFYFDSSKYSKKVLDVNFSKIEQTNYNYYAKNIIGIWNFEWSGSNWGTDQTSATKKRKIVFTDTDAFFYDTDTLMRQTKYIVTNKFAISSSKVIHFQLYFLDNKDLWNFSFRTTGADYIAHLKFDNQNVGLFINEMPNCSCGCPERIYLKEGATNYVIGK